MSKKSKSKYYVVWVGLNPGIYTSWAECQAQVVGYPDAKYKSFKTEAEANAAFDQSAMDYIANKKNASPKPDYLHFADEIEKNSYSVDAACSGKTGLMEYQCVDTFTKEVIFHMGPFADGTNNVGEYLGLVHALSYLSQQEDFDKIIYTDSRTALSWIRNKKVKTTLKKSGKNTKLFALLSRAQSWVYKNEIKTKVIKWDTERWGEIPADFGRK